MIPMQQSMGPQPQQTPLDDKQIEMLSQMQQLQQAQQQFAPRLSQALDLTAHTQIPPDSSVVMAKLMMALRKQGMMQMPRFS